MAWGFAREGEPLAWRRAGHAGVPIVAVTSGKGGVGKTNLAVNLVIALLCGVCG